MSHNTPQSNKKHSDLLLAVVAGGFLLFGVAFGAFLNPLGSIVVQNLLATPTPPPLPTPSPTTEAEVLQIYRVNVDDDAALLDVQVANTGSREVAINEITIELVENSTSATSGKPTPQATYVVDIDNLRIGETASIDIDRRLKPGTVESFTIALYTYSKVGVRLTLTYNGTRTVSYPSR